jgi:hypothetical protein
VTFKKGESGNPKGGIPKFQTFSWIINKYGIESIGKLQNIDTSKIPVKEALVIKQILAAYKDDDLKVVEWLANRADGAPKQTINTSNTTYKLNKKEYAKIRKDMIKEDDV